MRTLAILFIALTIGGCSCSSEVAGDPCASGGCLDAATPEGADGAVADAGAEPLADAGADAGACFPGAPPSPCGVGNACVQGCLANGTLGACQPANGPTDFLTDPAHCGACGNACPAPLHASRKCSAGKCGRTACEAGFFDLDGLPGCESACTGTTCTRGDGTTVIFTSPPVPESGLTFQALSSGTSHGGLVQTSPSHTNLAVLGEPTPAPEDGAVLKSPSYRLHGGFTAMEQSKK